MPSRNRSVKACELASRAPNDTASLSDFSDIAYASRLHNCLLILPQPWRGVLSIARPRPPVQRPRRKASDIVAARTRYRRTDNRGQKPFPAAVIRRRSSGNGTDEKKEPPLPAALRLNREASNRVDRSHSMSRRWTRTVMIEKA